MALRPRDFKSLAGTPKLLVQKGFYPFSKPYVQENVQVRGAQERSGDV